MANVFLSYSSGDREKALALRDVLVEIGYTVFLDVETPVGMNWDAWIRQNLAEAGCVVVLWSRSAAQSPNVQHEAHIARELGKLVPATLDSISPLELPMGFFTTQAAPLAGWTGERTSPSLAPLLKAIATTLSSTFVQKDDSGPVELSLLRTLAAQGDAGALRVLGGYYLVGQKVEQDLVTAGKLLGQAAYLGDADAQRIYSFFLRNGLHSVQADPEEGIRLLKAAAETGLPLAQHDLARAYVDGTHVPQNYKEAARLADLASRQGNTDAMVMLGTFCYHGQGVAQDYARCAELFQSAAKEGSVDAFHNLGVLYLQGHGLEQSDAGAFAMFTLAASKNKAESFESIGDMYRDGRTSSGRSFRKALDCYEASVRLGNAAAQKEYDALRARMDAGETDDGSLAGGDPGMPTMEPLRDVALIKGQATYDAAHAIENDDLAEFRKSLAEMVTDPGFVPTSFLDAASFLVPLAARNNPVAQALLGTLYLFGRGVPRSEVEACRLLRAAANENVPDAIFRLTVLLAGNDDLLEDGDDYLANLIKAARLHHPVALYKVGAMFAEGAVVERSYEQAATWMEYSAEAGYAPGQAVTGLYYLSGTGVEKNERKGFEYLERAVKQGWTEAYFYLARCHQEGWGTRRSNEAAIPLLRHAADRGNRDAQAALGFAYWNGTGVTTSLNDAAAHLQRAADNGHCDAQYAIGRLLETGIGIEESAEQAWRYYALAAAQGHEEARRKIEAGA